MRWTRADSVLVAFVWLGIAGIVVLVCVLLPTPPPPGDPRFASVLLDFFFGAVFIAIACGAAAVFCAFHFVQRLHDEIAGRHDQPRRTPGSRDDSA